MNKQLGWKFGLIIFVALASVYFMWPPFNRNLVASFDQRAMGKDAEFNALMQKVAAKQAAAPAREFANLREAIEEQKIDLRNYFPGITLKSDVKNPNLEILGQIDRNAAAKSLSASTSKAVPPSS